MRRFLVTSGCTMRFLKTEALSATGAYQMPLLKPVADALSLWQVKSTAVVVGI